MNLIKNEKGITLLEVLLSMTILSIIFISIMSFFPQMGSMNKQNEDKVIAVNTIKEILVEWQTSPEIRTFLQANPTPSIIPKSGVLIGDDYTFKSNYNNHEVITQIKNTPSLEPPASGPAGSSKAHLIHIQVINKRGTVVSEIYGYVII